MKYIIILAIAIYTVNKVMAMLAGPGKGQVNTSGQKPKEKNNDDDYIDYEEVR
jgi:hypothetical protein